MAMLVEMRKLSDDGRSARYGFSIPGGADRVLVFDRTEERIWPEDDTRDAIFRAAAGKLAKVWSEQGEAPETVVYQA